MTDAVTHDRLLKIAELQFRLASAVRLATTDNRQPLDLPLLWTHGRHTVEYNKIALTTEEADLAACYLHRSATYLMAVQIRETIKDTLPNAKEHPDSEIRSAFQIARLIRNAFAHNPFNPIWSIDPDCRDCTFVVRDIIALDTTQLQGKQFDWRDYGGPLALLRLSQFVRSNILGEVKRSAEPNAQTLLPSIEYYQQGNLILRRVKELQD